MTNGSQVMADRLSEGGRSLSFPTDEEPYQLEGEQVLAALASSLHGLTHAEGKRRLDEHGPNELVEEPPPGFWVRLAGQLRETLVLILIAAAVISGFLGEVLDAVVIMAIVILNAMLGVIQESKAERALEALRKLTQPHARVLREGRECSLPVRELVVGDIVLLEAGDQIPADIRLLEAAALRVDEAALTGESVPVDKTTDALSARALGDRTNMAFMGTVASAGRGVGVVTATGMNTELGKIAAMLHRTRPQPTPLQQRLAELGRVLGLGAIALVMFVFFIGIKRGEPLHEMFLTAVSLAVAVIPEGLPAISTVTLALGVQRMQKRNAIIRKLPAVETLGTATVICSDKTGTLTQNKMTVKRIYIGGRYVENFDHIDLLLTAGALANDACLYEDGQCFGDPTELALLAAAKEGNLDANVLNEKYPRRGEIPFDSERKLMSTWHRWGDPLPWGEAPPYLSITKGAPDRVLPRCAKVFWDNELRTMDKALLDELFRANGQLAGEAYRVLAVAVRPWPQEPGGEEVEEDLIFLGLVGMVDPPREEVYEAVRLCHQAGIRPIMITGDFPDTALAIAAQLDIVPSTKAKVITGQELDRMDAGELAAVVEDVSVFARVAPQDKLKIVEALQAKGHVVAMTGDGVNDAPALKRADIGAAMGDSGTDVAREASDLILVDDNFATIVAAVAEGRTIYANIRKSIQSLLACNMGELLVITSAILMGIGRPLTAIQILWVNLITDGLPALSLSVEPAEKGIMKQKPRPPKQGVFAEGLGTRILIHGALIGGVSLVAYRWALANYDLAVARSATFAVLAFSQLFYSFSARSAKDSLLELGLLSNPQIIYAFFGSGLLQLLVMLIPPVAAVFNVVPMGLDIWMGAIGMALIPMLIVEMVKFLQRDSD